ncbi:MAG: 16S rRNA (cytosine(1402)-N(4))-methyltransferase RsmH [Actinomycetaceae bacterium]|nr:16S rRNA (cytosine(1402)-N(4))-methyltransferase RsmH [Actinomycetaceae bacterium]
MTAATAHVPTHEPVLAQACWQLIAPAFTSCDTPVIIDATLGLGGHSQYFLDNHPHVIVIGIDRDMKAIEHSQRRLEPYGDRFIAVHTTYDHIAQAMEVASQHSSLQGLHSVNAVFMDLGVSSMQLDDDERGFAYSRNTALDMRMDQRQTTTARDLINTASVKELASIIKEYGEERNALRIARLIEETRKKAPIESSQELTDIVFRAIPRVQQGRSGHPAKRTFQALRIAVNDELEILRRSIPTVIEVLALKGRLVVESYHSLEDRIVKTAMKKAASVQVPDDLPVTADALQADFQLVTPKAIQATKEEKESNPRSRSVRLRALERVRYPQRRCA